MSQSLQANLEAFADAVGDKVKEIRVLINGNVADLADLDTTAKESVVAAINDLKAQLDAIPRINDTATNLSSTWSSSKINDEILTALNGVLANVPTALDTLQEIANAINNDANFAATMLGQIDKRVRWDTATQNLTIGQKANARINIDAASATDVGNTDFDYVALFNQGLL